MQTTNKLSWIERCAECLLSRRPELDVDQAVELAVELWEQDDEGTAPELIAAQAADRVPRRSLGLSRRRVPRTPVH
ncbi:hypothetical protein OOT46_23635 [Aquabacterium sp. A7-Y]|uniref:hypothetical protein n=1 Tax=Aquabacterium sp. A7-Y TaxID=1349605 RepID=UPI00223E6600|nr:hypothetical protein [Aquabacterium sp. A7-Y]MCW7540816.1 hypothetical protein [Aquabacterium sp. A7-Y]